MIDIIWDELTSGLPDMSQLAHVILRLTAATLLGGAVGIQRMHAGKPAGLRTHILVCLGTTVFIISCAGGGISSDGVSRVVQGVAAGIGFIGAGSILKLSDLQSIHGLTTAAGIWMTAAIGVAIGLGTLGIALLSTCFPLIILSIVGEIEHRIEGKKKARGQVKNIIP